MVCTSLNQLDFRVYDLPEVPPARRVLFTTPDFYDVEYVINPHMARNVGSVDRARAREQWAALRKAYAGLGLEVETLPGEPGLPDMVFCANQTLPYSLPDGARGAVLSRMHARQRAPEVEHYRKFFEAADYRTISLPPSIRDFEGMGDALWHTGRFLLWGGFGFRSSLDAYRYLSDELGVQVVALRLEDPEFYHLDTCLSVIDERTALVFPGAFDSTGLELLGALFPDLIEAPEVEARSLFACNAHSPDGQHVIIQRGCFETVSSLKAAGFSPVEVETSEFLKSGGSVFCMKQMYW